MANLGNTQSKNCFIHGLIGVNPNTLLENRALFGHLVESFVYQELRRQASSSDEPYMFHHFRNRDGGEVDLIIERGALELAGIEIKASATVFDSDFKELRRIKAAHPDKFRWFYWALCGLRSKPPQKKKIATL
ncbi:MAG: DUF4143 domain-containing protein, partial [Bacteroidetes bacterium]|nr:DUF4143 domain-containing protein [Bacteroidota bacterium]